MGDVQPISFGLSVDIEPTNRCNADCWFCPRDQTPHEGLMSAATFAQALSRTVDFRAEVLERVGLDVRVNLSGLGEPLINPRTADFIADARATGAEVAMSSNASLLDERRSAAVLGAGLQRIFINVGELDDGYEEIYGLPFERTRDNVLRFAEEAEGRCELYLVLVDHRRDPAHLERVRSYWTERGIIAFMEFEIMNRGGALFVDHMQFESLPQIGEARRMLGDREKATVCGAPFGYLFIGYDGQYYLCCSDWKKEVPFGSVFDLSFLDITRAKLEHVVGRRSICRTCSLDPVNKLTDELRAADAGDIPSDDVQHLLADLATNSDAALGWIEALRPGVTDPWPAAGPSDSRRLIPVRSV